LSPSTQVWVAGSFCWVTGAGVVFPFKLVSDAHTLVTANKRTNNPTTRYKDIM
jgi:hypothetical protein